MLKIEDPAVIERTAQIRKARRDELVFAVEVIPSPKYHFVADGPVMTVDLGNATSPVAVDVMPIFGFI
jgi:hypothetical protein